MIGRLTGHVLERSPGRVLLDVGGVGYDVQISLQTFYALPSAPAGGQAATLHVHTHVREDTLQLYGFASPDERRTFEMLIGLSGVGPRLALSILSGIGVEDLTRTVFQQDRARLQRIPGVGKKTAERLLLELRDKVGASEPAGGGLPAELQVPDGAPTGLGADALSALLNLGYGRPVAERAVGEAIDAAGVDTSLESVLKAALSRLVR